jgi:ketosteroid isomerase-like protein
MDYTIDPEILALEKRLTEATRDLDVEGLDSVYADDIILTGVTGVICDKKAVMDEARRGLEARGTAAAPGTPSVVSYDKDDVRVARHGRTAVTSFRFRVTIRGGDQDVTRAYRTTNVWMRRADRWQIVAAHTAILG